MDTLTNNFSDSGQDKDGQKANWQIAIEDVLRKHPGVRDVAVIREAGDNFVAFVVPDDDYVDDVLGRGTASSKTVGKWQKIFDLSQLSQPAASASVGFNTMGWDSSYTRNAIPADEMREWVENTVSDILPLKPKSVCEIGCGTGMLVMRVAPHCESYVAVDFSPVVLDRLRGQLQTVPAIAERVKLVESRAADIDGLGEDSFDTVVINSVIQYFPNATYLTKVLENAVKIVRPGGHVYVGDVRSLPLLRAFASSVELFQAADEMSARQLREQIRRRVERDPELVLSPAYFLSLQHRFPKISRVEIRPLRGHADNEMTRFRYSAILHIGHENAAPTIVEFLDWAERELTLDEIRSMLKQNPNQHIGMNGIRNARIKKDLAAMAILDGADAACTFKELRHRAEQTAREAIHPQALLHLEAEDLGFGVFLSWAACRHDGSYDACLIPAGQLQGVDSPVINWPAPDASELAHLANAPGQVRMRTELTAQLLEHCAQNLPHESVPREIVLVDTLERIA